MTEIFLAYDSSDRDRVRPVRDALAPRAPVLSADLRRHTRALDRAAG